MLVSDYIYITKDGLTIYFKLIWTQAGAGEPFQHDNKDNFVYEYSNLVSV